MVRPSLQGISRYADPTFALPLWTEVRCTSVSEAWHIYGEVWGQRCYLPQSRLEIPATSASLLHITCCLPPAPSLHLAYLAPVFPLYLTCIWPVSFRLEMPTSGVVVDVGANIGLFSLWAAAQGGALKVLVRAHA